MQENPYTSYQFLIILPGYIVAIASFFGGRAFGTRFPIKNIENNPLNQILLKSNIILTPVAWLIGIFLTYRIWLLI